MATYSESLRQRLAQISDNAEALTTWDKLKQARQRQQRSSQDAIRQLNGETQMYNQRLANYGQMTGGPTGPGKGNFQSFINSIANKESNGNYGAVNRQSGAMGKYQIIPSNIAGKGRGWDWEALGRDISTSQFMSNPALQDQIAQFKLQQYYQNYGPAGASIAWYAGPGAAKKYARTGSVSTRTEAGGYPSVAAYMQAILNGYS